MERNDTIAVFTQKKGTKSAVRILADPFPDITAFDTVVRMVIQKNPFGCTSSMSAKINHQPVQRVREMHTAKFVYENLHGKRNGHGLDRYNTIEGYENGIAAVRSNMAKIVAHGGKVKHIPAADLFSVTLKCHDPNNELCFPSIARDRVTLSSYNDDRIRTQVETWADGVPALG